MNAIITLGIDMSSQPKGTAACTVTWEADRAVTTTPCLGCDDEMLSEMIAKSDAVGIDAPFGWPAEFAVAVGAWTFTSWTTELRERLFPGDRSSCARNRGTLAAERLCGSDRAAGDAYIRAVDPPWNYGSHRRQKVFTRSILQAVRASGGLRAGATRRTRRIIKKREKASWTAYARRCHGWSCQMLASRPGMASTH